MNIVDLELYKWQLHRMGAFSVPKLKPRNMGVSKFSWQAEYGTFISMLPRQAGKTELLIRMAKILQNNNESFLIVVPKVQMKDEILKRFNIDPGKIEVIQVSTTMFNFLNMTELKLKNTNLLVDEYTLLRSEALRHLFGVEWKSISMVGGLRL